MNQSRLEQLLEFLREDPRDPFNLYVVATEYLATHPEKALFYYEQLLREHENYVPTYYHAAQLYASLGNRETAAETYRKGIAISEQTGDRHALRELQNAYQMFLEDE